MRLDHRFWIVLLMAFAVLSCSSSKEQAEVDRDEIQATLQAYLPLLGEVYATGDLSLLEGWAAEKEISRIHKRIEDLSIQGRRLVPTFRSLTVEKANVWNYSNCYVTTLEVWDLEVRATGTEQVLSSQFEKADRVQYQLKRQDDRWRVLFRTIQQ
jgi:hypothetical protein